MFCFCKKIVFILCSERTNNQVTLEWRPAPSYGELAIVGYKVYINNRLVAILSHDQLTYTLTNGSACEEYTAYVQALSNDKNISSPMSRGVKFSWPGIKAGTFQRLDDGQTGTVVVAWEHPKLEDDTEKLIGFKVGRMTRKLKNKISLIASFGKCRNARGSITW